MVAKKIGPLAPVIKRSGTSLKAEVLDNLLHLRVDRAAGLVGRATLRFADYGYSLSTGDTFALGTAISIAEPEAGLLIEGTVTGMSLEQGVQGGPELVVVADDAGYKLTRGTEVATYLNGTYSQVLQKIASRHGLRPRIQSSTLTMEYLLQAGTDLAYLNSICERLGYAWFIDDNSTLVVEKFAVGAPSATLTLGDDLRELSVRASGLRPTAVTVHGWNPDQQQEVTDTNPAAVPGEPSAFVKPYLGTKPSGPLSASATSVAHSRPLTNGEAKSLADAYYTEWSSAAVVARGSGEINSKIKPGKTVRVKDAGPASGSYLVTAVEHVYDRTGFSTKFTSGSHRPSGLVDTLGPVGVDPGFQMSGLIVGIVTDAADPDDAGRVKVRFTGINGEIESPWARVVSFGAGNARGSVFNPEVNDEVLVGFEHGDTRRPVVLGGLYSKRNTLPTGQKYVAEGKVNYRRIASRKNHMVELADGEQPDQQHILLQIGTASHKLRLGADRFDIEVAAGKPITIKAGSAMFDINAEGNISIEGKNVTIKADGTLLLQGGQKATLASNAQTQIQGTQVQVKADANASVEASGPLALKGAVVQVN